MLIAAKPFFRKEVPQTARRRKKARCKTLLCSLSVEKNVFFFWVKPCKLGHGFLSWKRFLRAEFAGQTCVASSGVVSGTLVTQIERSQNQKLRFRYWLPPHRAPAGSSLVKSEAQKASIHSIQRYYAVPVMSSSCFLISSCAFFFISSISLNCFRQKCSLFLGLNLD